MCVCMRGGVGAPPPHIPLAVSLTSLLQKKRRSAFLHRSSESRPAPPLLFLFSWKSPPRPLPNPRTLLRGAANLRLIPSRDRGRGPCPGGAASRPPFGDPPPHIPTCCASSCARCSPPSARPARCGASAPRRLTPPNACPGSCGTSHAGSPDTPGICSSPGTS